MEKGRAKEGRGIRESSRCKNSLEEDKETSKKNTVRKKIEIELKHKPTISLVLFHAVFDREINSMCVHMVLFMHVKPFLPS